MGRKKNGIIIPAGYTFGMGCALGAALCLVPVSAHAGFLTNGIQAVVASFADMLMSDEATACADILLGTDDGFLASILANGDTAYKAVEIFGLLLVGIYGTYDLLNELKRGDPDMDMFLRILTRQTVAVMVICAAFSVDTAGMPSGYGEGLTFVNAIDAMGQSIVQYIADNLTAVEAQVELSDWIASADFDTGILGTIQTIAGLVLTGAGALYTLFNMSLSVLILQVNRIIIRAMSYTLFLEMLIRHALFPIAAAQIASRDQSARAFRYIRGYLGLYFKMSLFLIIVCLEYRLVYSMAWSSIQQIIDSTGAAAASGYAVLSIFLTGATKGTTVFTSALFTIGIVYAGIMTMQRGDKMMKEVFG